MAWAGHRDHSVCGHRLYSTDWQTLGACTCPVTEECCAQHRCRCAPCTVAALSAVHEVAVQGLHVSGRTTLPHAPRWPKDVWYLHLGGGHAWTAQVPAATGLTIRVINNVTKKMDVKPKFYEAFKKDGYPASFEFRQKVMLFGACACAGLVRGPAVQQGYRPQEPSPLCSLSERLLESLDMRS